MIKKLIEKLNNEKCLYIKVKVRPSASKAEIKKILDDETIKIDIDGPAEKGKANVKLIKLLSKIFKVEKDKINITCGKTDKTKLIRINK